MWLQERTGRVVRKTEHKDKKKYWPWLVRVTGCVF